MIYSGSWPMYRTALRTSHEYRKMTKDIVKTPKDNEHYEMSRA